MRMSAGGRLAARFLALALLLLAGLGAALPAAAQSVDDLLPVREAYRLSADVATPGVVRLRFRIAPDYYLYRGQMKFSAGAGVTLGEATFPDGLKFHDEYLGDVEIYHHEVEAVLPYTLAPGVDRLALTVGYQGCHEVEPKICYPPQKEKLDLAVPVAAAMTPTGRVLEDAFARFSGNPLAGEAAPGGAPLPDGQAFRLQAALAGSDRLLLRWTLAPGYYLYREQLALRPVDAAGVALEPVFPAGVQHDDAYYGATEVYFDELELPVAIRNLPAGSRSLQLDVRYQGCQDQGLCYPAMTRRLAVDLAGGSVAVGEVPATAGAGAGAPDTGADAAAASAGGDPNAGVETAPASAVAGLGLALLLALGGGLVLNLMPCVLPVLSIKAVGLIESGADATRRRQHALAYTAGVLASFAVLGLAIAALKSAWGVQLQNPLVVAVLALVMLAVGLSMSGVVEFGRSLGNTGSALAGRSGLAGDFFTGVLAVVVASPCTAPFMGPALGYAFVAPTAHALAVFLALGLGLALPFLAVGFVPALARLLPRPGAWMLTLKQVLAFPMYLAAAWLAWVLAKQRGADAVGLLLVAGVLLALALWWFERSRTRGAFSRALVGVAFALVLLPVYALAQLPPAGGGTAPAGGVVAYSPQRLAALRAAGTPVLVDMTADWCITCKANEHTVLSGAAFRQLLADTGTVYMQGDWTGEDPAITAFLKAWHTPGVPLYVVFPANGGEGRRLPTVLTGALVERALREAAG